jgi:hypothetical protein
VLIGSGSVRHCQWDSDISEAAAALEMMVAMVALVPAAAATSVGQQQQ